MSSNNHLQKKVKVVGGLVATYFATLLTKAFTDSVGLTSKDSKTSEGQKTVSKKRDTDNDKSEHG